MIVMIARTTIISINEQRKRAMARKIIAACGGHIRGRTIAVLGLTFAWKKVSVDTMVQESLPDGYRGRVFSVYDFFYNMARLVAALVAVALFPVLSSASTLICSGLLSINCVSARYSRRCWRRALRCSSSMPLKFGWL